MATLAFRDFPDGCGPFSGCIVGCVFANGTILEDKNVEHLGGDTVKTFNCDEVKDSLLTRACMVEPVVIGRYLPRIKVSAVRDYLPLFRRKAPPLGKYKKVGQQNLAVDENPLKKVAAADVNVVKINIQDEYGCKRKLVDIVQTGSERNAAKIVKKLHAFETSSEIKMPPENKREKYVTLPEKSNHHQVEINSNAAVKEENRDGTKPLVISRSKHKLKGNFNRLRLRVSSDRKEVLGLMAKSECPWRSDKGSFKFKFVDS